MNEMTRSIETVTAEIILIRENAKRTFFSAVIEIGNRLIEAKELVPQGKWLEYLDKTLNYKSSTAQNYMRIAREYGGGQIGLDGKSAEDVFGELGYTQLLPLLGVPEEDRRELAESNNLADMSSRQVEKLVADYKAAKQAVETADRRLIELGELKEKSDKALAKAEQAETNERNAREAAEKKVKKLEGRIEHLLQESREKPIEGQATVMPTDEEIEKLREEIRAEQSEIISSAQARADDAERKLEAAKNPTLALCNFLFGELQNNANRLAEALERLCAEDAERGEKVKNGILNWYKGRTER